MVSGHYPGMKTLLMIENAIINSEYYPTRMQLYRSLPTKIEYMTFKRALEYLEVHDIIIFEDRSIVYTSGKSEKLQNFMKTIIKI